jgi:uncharacterized cysteine cluster protein YcgN (CxxCxxCC family)/dihydrodipicolinate synthase/N-acetylneuraminate lyase
MTDGNDQSPVPFWQRKTLSEMTEAEWESICDGCGRCCLEKLGADDSEEVFPLDVGCTLLDPVTARCTDYQNRLARDVGCFQVTPERVPVMPWLPPSCGYQRIHLGKPLDWWHPLVSGDPDTVRQAGISAGGRFVTRQHAGPMEYHTVDWPSREVTREPRDQWITAMFGGVNASVPTPFGTDQRVDLDLMAAHCFWLIANGCHGLAILDKAGEVASLAVEERIAVIEGLVSRGVPASKLLVGVGPAALADGARIAARAADLGIRGIMLSVSAPIRLHPDRVMPHDVLPAPIRQLMQSAGTKLHLYLSLSVSPVATAAGLIALETFVAQAPGRLRGIRDETAGGVFGLAALERFRGTLFEVYTTDETALANLVQHGGAGLISARANLLGRFCAQIMQAAETQNVAQIAVGAACKALPSRSVVPAIKALVARHTGQPNWGRVRLPLRPPLAAERAALFKAFDATGIRLHPAL